MTEREEEEEVKQSQGWISGQVVGEREAQGEARVAVMIQLSLSQPVQSSTPGWRCQWRSIALIYSTRSLEFTTTAAQWEGVQVQC